MNKKIIVTLIVLLFCISCFSIVTAENITNGTTDANDTINTNDGKVLDMSNHIKPISIIGNRIEFSDGFTGFCLDLTKADITNDDGFVSEPTSNSGIQNYVKLAIIEAYKQGCESNLNQIIASFSDGSYASSNDKVISAVLKSQEKIGDSAVVELEDSTEGTFEFELLKDLNGSKSDCLAYRVSIKEVDNNGILGAAANNNTTEKTNDITSTTVNKTNETVTNKTNETTTNQTVKNKTNQTTVNKTNENVTNKTNETTTNQTVKNETNQTTNKTNETKTVIINNTTINQNNTKIINANETPQNATIVTKLIKAVGNPIFILMVVIVIIAVVGIYVRKKG
ncbi:MAG: hypothetical protein E7Z77_08870 [Methanobrevibacter sp.]|uniref:hypothetical protein n=1 Tax=Methanobrevibacter sp. TaxID=66852 RepID=UPI0025DD860D|nr:hypothetical protein [Methanobrevibacter sp.]MBE6509506.1 hypothetical protein [Methanobrevibacter sp.]